MIRCSGRDGHLAFKFGLAVDIDRRGGVVLGVGGRLRAVEHIVG